MSEVAGEGCGSHAATAAEVATTALSTARRNDRDGVRDRDTSSGAVVDNDNNRTEEEVEEGVAATTNVGMPLDGSSSGSSGAPSDNNAAAAPVIVAEEEGSGEEKEVSGGIGLGEIAPPESTSEPTDKEQAVGTREAAVDREKNNRDNEEEDGGETSKVSPPLTALMIMRREREPSIDYTLEEDELDDQLHRSAPSLAADVGDPDGAAAAAEAEGGHRSMVHSASNHSFASAASSRSRSNVLDRSGHRSSSVRRSAHPSLERPRSSSWASFEDYGGYSSAASSGERNKSKNKKKERRQIREKERKERVVGNYHAHYGCNGDASQQGGRASSQTAHDSRSGDAALGQSAPSQPPSNVAPTGYNRPPGVEGGSDDAAGRPSAAAAAEIAPLPQQQPPFDYGRAPGSQPMPPVRGGGGGGGVPPPPPGGNVGRDNGGYYPPYADSRYYPQQQQQQQQHYAPPQQWDRMGQHFPHQQQPRDHQMGHYYYYQPPPPGQPSYPAGPHEQQARYEGRGHTSGAAAAPDPRNNYYYVPPPPTSRHGTERRYPGRTTSSTSRGAPSAASRHHPSRPGSNRRHNHPDCPDYDGDYSDYSDDDGGGAEQQHQQRAASSSPARPRGQNRMMMQQHDSVDRYDPRYYSSSVDGNLHQQERGPHGEHQRQHQQQHHHHDPQAHQARYFQEQPPAPSGYGGGPPAPPHYAERDYARDVSAATSACERGGGRPPEWGEQKIHQHHQQIQHGGRNYRYGEYHGRPPKTGRDGGGWEEEEKREIDAAAPHGSNGQPPPPPVANEGSAQSSSVSFSTIEIRSYERILGDNPSCSSGPAVSIGWRYEPDPLTLSIDEFEYYRTGDRLDGPELVLSRSEREEIIEAMGYSRSDIAEAVRVNVRVKKQRRQTVHNLPVMKFEEMAEKAKRRMKRLVFKNSNKQGATMAERSGPNPETTAAAARGATRKSSLVVRSESYDDHESSSCGKSSYAAASQESRASSLPPSCKILAADAAGDDAQRKAAEAEAPKTFDPSYYYPPGKQHSMEVPVARQTLATEGV